MNYSTPSNRHPHPLRAHTAAPIDPLEPRRLLSAAISHHTLIIEGTRRADTIVLTNDSPKTLRVRIGQTETTFLKRDFSKIRITAGRGDDLVTVGSDANPVTTPAAITGDDGDDTLLGGAANDSISGGAGADQITGAAGDDKISGDNGNDDVHGGNGDDALSGGRGDDQLHDDPGADTCSGNTGIDLLYYDGTKPRQLRDAAKSEQAYAEPTFNIKKRPHTAAVLNTCPLDTVDARHIQGGLIRAGGSTLVVAGNILQQWSGQGLETSNAFVPHFDLPGGGSYVSGSMEMAQSGLYANNLVTGGSILSVSGFSVNSGTLMFTGSGVGGTLNLVNPIHLTKNLQLTAPADTLITNADATTHTLLAGETLALTGPATITLKTGPQLLVDPGITIKITVGPAPATVSTPSTIVQA